MEKLLLQGILQKASWLQMYLMQVMIMIHPLMEMGMERK